MSLGLSLDPLMSKNVEASRISDADRDLKSLRENMWKFGHKIDGYLQEIRQWETGPRHSFDEAKLDGRHLGRDLPRTTLGEVSYGSLEAKFARCNEVKLLIFDGSSQKVDFLDWIDTLEDYFQATNPPDAVKCKLATSKLRGEARTWWNELQNTRFSKGKNLITSWSRMSDLLHERFLNTSRLTRWYKQENEGDEKHANYSMKCPLESYGSSQSGNCEHKIGHWLCQPTLVKGTEAPMVAENILNQVEEREILGASMNVTTHIGIDVLEKTSSPKTAIDEKDSSGGSREVESSKSRVDKFMLTSCLKEALNRDVSLSLIASETDTNPELLDELKDNDNQEQLNEAEQVFHIQNVGPQASSVSSDIKTVSKFGCQKGNGFQGLGVLYGCNGDSEAGTTFIALKMLKTGPYDVDFLVKDTMMRNFDPGGTCKYSKNDRHQQLEHLGCLDLLQSNAKEIPVKEVLGAAQGIYKEHIGKLQRGIYQPSQPGIMAVDGCGELIGAVLRICQVLISNLFLSYGTITAGMLSFTYDPGGILCSIKTHITSFECVVLRNDGGWSSISCNKLLNFCFTVIAYAYGNRCKLERLSWGIPYTDMVRFANGTLFCICMSIWHGSILGRLHGSLSNFIEEKVSRGGVPIDEGSYVLTMHDIGNRDHMDVDMALQIFSIYSKSSIGFRDSTTILEFLMLQKMHVVHILFTFDPGGNLYFSGASSLNGYSLHGSYTSLMITTTHIVFGKNNGSYTSLMITTTHIVFGKNNLLVVIGETKQGYVSWTNLLDDFITALRSDQLVKGILVRAHLEIKPPALVISTFYISMVHFVKSVEEEVGYCSTTKSETYLLDPSRVFYSFDHVVSSVRLVSKFCVTLLIDSRVVPDAITIEIFMVASNEHFYTFIVCFERGVNLWPKGSPKIINAVIHVSLTTPYACFMLDLKSAMYMGTLRYGSVPRMDSAKGFSTLYLSQVFVRITSLDMDTELREVYSNGFSLEPSVRNHSVFLWTEVSTTYDNFSLDNWKEMLRTLNPAGVARLCNLGMLCGMLMFHNRASLHLLNLELRSLVITTFDPGGIVFSYKTWKHVSSSSLDVTTPNGTFGTSIEIIFIPRIISLSLEDYIVNSLSMWFGHGGSKRRSCFGNVKTTEWQEMVKFQQKRYHGIVGRCYALDWDSLCDPTRFLEVLSVPMDFCISLGRNFLQVFREGLILGRLQRQTRGRVIPWKGWNDRNDENNVNTQDMFIRAKIGVVILSIWLSILSKGGHPRKTLRLFFKTVNGLDPPTHMKVKMDGFNMDSFNVARGRAFLNRGME